MNKQDKDKKDEKNSSNNTAIFIILGIAVLIILICIAAVFYRYSSNDFKYNGIEFNKNYMGDLIFYTAKVPVMDAYGRISGYKAIDFRNDPRTLKNIVVNTSDGIRFIDDGLAYISYGEINKCEDNSLAATYIGLFFSITDIEYRGAVDDPLYKKNSTIPYVNCQRNPWNSVVLIKAGNETKIEQTDRNCYELTFKDCDILKVIEKFELTILEQYMEGIIKK